MKTPSVVLVGLSIVVTIFGCWQIALWLTGLMGKAEATAVAMGILAVMAFCGWLRVHLVATQLRHDLTIRDAELWSARQMIDRLRVSSPQRTAARYEGDPR